MPIAYCNVCRKEIVAVPRPRKILGGYTLNTPGRLHPVMLVQAPEEFCCPDCGHAVVTDQQIRKFESDSKMSEVLFWGSAGLLLVSTVGGLIVAAGTGGRFNIGIMGLLVFAVPGAYLALLLYGERRLPATGLVALLTVLLLIGFNMESREDVELRRQDQQRRVEEGREHSERDAREEQARQEAALREQQLAAETARHDESEREARRAAAARQEERSRRDVAHAKATAEALKHRGNVVYSASPFTVHLADGDASFEKGTPFLVIYHNPDGTTCVETRDDVRYPFQNEYGNGMGLVRSAAPDGLTVSDSCFTAEAEWVNDSPLGN